MPEKERPLYFENFDLENVVTPVNVPALKQLLDETGYNLEKSKKIIDGFTNGFSLGYSGNENVQRTAPNLKLRIGNPTILWNKVMKEVKNKRYAGPFETIPFDNYIQSPIGLVPKDNGTDTRLIFHLSYPRNGKKKSVNANTDPSLCSVKYPDFSDAIKLCMKEGIACKLGKSDMQAAFRNLGILKKHWKFLVIMAISPIDGKKYYFVDKALPFGSSISCAHFQDFSNAVAHIVKKKSGKSLVNYLDDYLFAALLAMICNNHIQLFLDICETINFPVSLGKTFWADTRIIFLGMLIDTVAQTVSVPISKIEKAIDLIQTVLNKVSRKITMKDLQKLCGFLNFLCRCIVPGRAFTRRLYAYTAGKDLKPHHHIRVTGEMRSDLTMWLQFLHQPEAYCRPFIDFENTLMADEINFYTDAPRPSAGGDIGIICGWLNFGIKNT